jgi:hypothetical protein
MSLTRIKEAFAILKQMISECRGSNGEAKERGAEKEGSVELLRQIEDLKSCLVQRDTEIAILVNMVKKGKVASSAPSEIISEFDGQQLEAEKSSSLSTTSDVRKSTKTAISASENADRYSAEPKKDLTKVIKRFLFNIPPPDDVKIVDDIAGETKRTISSLYKDLDSRNGILLFSLF